MQNEPESTRSPRRLADPVGLAGQQRTRPASGRATAMTSPSATSWSPGSTRTTSPGTTSSARSSVDLAVADRPAPAARPAAASWSSVSFALISWRIPMQLLTIAIRPKRASANRPSDRIEDEEDADDRVEEREDVAGDDAGGRAAGSSLGRAEPAQALRRLGGGQAFTGGASLTPSSIQTWPRLGTMLVPRVTDRVSPWR